MVCHHPRDDYRLELPAPEWRRGRKHPHIYQRLRFAVDGEQSRGHARFFPARKTAPLWCLLPNWNAKWDGQLSLCRWLNKLGISVLRMSMPYHDRRAIPGHERADHMVGSNVGLTLHATGKP